MSVGSNRRRAPVGRSSETAASVVKYRKTRSDDGRCILILISAGHPTKMIPDDDSSRESFEWNFAKDCSKRIQTSLGKIE